MPRQLSSLACSTSEPRHTPCSSGSSPSSRASGRYGATVLPSSRQLGFSTSPSPQRLSQPSSFLRSSRDCLASISIATCHNAIDNAKYNPPQSWCRRFHATTILSSQYDCTDQASLVKSLRKRGDIQSNSVEQVMLQVWEYVAELKSRGLLQPFVQQKSERTNQLLVGLNLLLRSWPTEGTLVSFAVVDYFVWFCYTWLP